MRLGVVLLILLAIIFGATFGALNAERVVFDLYVLELSLPKGAALLAVLLLGWICGGLLVWFVRVRRLRREVRKMKRQLHEARTGAATSSDLPAGRA